MPYGTSHGSGAIACGRSNFQLTHLWGAADRIGIGAELLDSRIRGQSQRHKKRASHTGQALRGNHLITFATMPA